jgi:hypothetical protein
LRDSLPQFAADTLGAPFSLAGSILKSAGQLLHGDTLVGMQGLLPRALRDATGAYILNERGYVDSSGRKMAISPTGMDVLTKALGFQPADLAQYYQEKKDISGNVEARKVRAGYLKQNFFVALNEGDRDKQLDLIRQMQSYDRDHPEAMILPHLARDIVSRRRQEATAQATGIPTGVSFKEYLFQHRQ